jgi:uncharacterized Ntn-hydrolase superfamily protein
MLEAYEASDGSLTERLLVALEAAEAAGGDIRGRQSAAILVVPPDGSWWQTSVSLRVEDHPDPLVELRRLVRLQQAYTVAGRGDELTNEGRSNEAAELYKEASELAPGNHELLFWSGLGTAQSGDIDGGVRQVSEAIALQPGWAELLPRLGADVSPAAAEVAERLGLS